MSKKETLNLFLDLVDYFKLICNDIDREGCLTGKCPFAKKVANGDYVCIFEERGMEPPYNWKETEND